ncbi:uncharacterized protein LOC133309926 [Gastrolobium bilobum]|uniref:uncharacterized protein LOC133309926 n=1 Tax=Gastrolobium bilobum TaxID=150636 RepID=UPI002AB2B6C9|nr:uncharacterized protein LOC133309926 [Gastrolobium bilobum]
MVVQKSGRGRKMRAAPAKHVPNNAGSSKQIEQHKIVNVDGGSGEMMATDCHSGDIVLDSAADKEVGSLNIQGSSGNIERKSRSPNPSPRVSGPKKQKKWGIKAGTHRGLSVSSGGIHKGKQNTKVGASRVQDSENLIPISQSMGSQKMANRIKVFKSGVLQPSQNPNILGSGRVKAEATLNNMKSGTMPHYLEDRSMELVTFVYGSPRRCEREILWENLEELAASVNSPWIILGDFNSVLKQCEKVGGMDVCWRSIMEMQDCLDLCGVSDIGFKGPSFTWKKGNLQERLDRACANEEWNMAWPNRFLGHLPFFNSDHRPILVSNYQSSRELNGVKQFKFLAAWLTDPDFGNIVKRCWEEKGDWNEARKEFEVEASNWHHFVFREVLRQKHRLYARIQGLDWELEYRYDRELARLQGELWKELETILLREEVSWFQRSQVSWLKFGDKNTKFFHSTTIARRRSNKVLAIKNERGEWTADSSELVETVVGYFWLRRGIMRCSLSRVLSLGWRLLR